ncbi:16S rRNA (uracil(1498)-N(3))-methyltransferase [Novilysobacter spongiicola]|uniref:Ribosomal RNA small subunit methyltransferase E n=1 Tax=Lysobacter spongiicola DSM 21749 TaxID=1122188 RepID=A0A1T4R008_9GAMM|nr:16S rRNA (uracil(1498)-N(3))-methyltransferase [Lysobacter spongiicola]SKA08928.1 16S rRNA (uracil1498-N3)-methyltransferase [Lysobacter spongiicola DSM 21749]
MRLTRLYVEAPLAPGAEITLPEAAAGHLVRVLRLGVGDSCVLFNGDGHDYSGTVSSVSKREARVRVGAATEVRRESELRIVLLQGIARGEKMDLILQKATELGVSEVRPLESQRSEVRLDEARALKRLAHWRNVVASACGQCGRAGVPDVSPPAPLSAVLGGLPDGGTRLILDPMGDCALPTLEIDGMVVLAVGPEGGWSPLDRDQLMAAGFRGLRLGPRILRTETAGLAAIAALQALHGDLG